MLTRTQFIIMLLLSIAGTAFAWYLQSFINWMTTLEWMKRVQLYEFVCVCVFVAAVIFAYWINETVKKIVQAKDDMKRLEEEHRERVADKVQRSKLLKQKVDVE